VIYEAVTYLDGHDVQHARAESEAVATGPRVGQVADAESMGATPVLNFGRIEQVKGTRAWADGDSRSTANKVRHHEG
jgi:hypothetical protein